MSKLPFVTLNHYTLAGFQTQDVVLKEDAEKLEAENKRLRAAFEICHTYHMYPRHCASMVDHHYHELFPEAYNPHKKDQT